MADNNLIIKSPVVVVLGHVDAGKTSILDAIRKTKVAEKESGGITQHIGAYQVEKNGKKITFIDTPGHEAFSQMRTRGASVADIAVLVVDSAQGVQPQTREAISIVKEAGIPLIVAFNKMDKPEANPERAKRDLMKEDVNVESFGGKIPSVEISAITGKGIEELLDMILLISEMEDLKSDLSRPARGFVIESHLDSQTGARATLILSEGILERGSIIATNSSLGRIKILEDFHGNQVEKSFPADPVVALGFDKPPIIGEEFKTFSTTQEAESYVKVVEKPLSPDLFFGQAALTAGDGGDRQFLDLIIKADCYGSLEAIAEVLKNIPQDKIVLRALKVDVGDVNESDIKLARSGKARVLGFRVKINPVVKSLAERDKVKVKTFEIIYDLVELVRKLMEAILKSETVRVDLGKVKVLALFFAEKNRQVLGGKILEGEIERSGKIEIFRGEELLGRGRLVNLQKNKKDVEKLGKGEECGMLYEGDLRVQEGDVLAVYKEEERKDVL